MSRSSVRSPCVGWCRKNTDNICEGCGRTVDEIGDWYLANDQQKQIIVERAAERIKSMPDAYYRQ